LFASFFLSFVHSLSFWFNVPFLSYDVPSVLKISLSCCIVGSVLNSSM
jgi:hypothetical protein